MNDQQRAAMTMALEALEVLLTCKHGEFCDHYRDAERQSRLAITALREALAQPQGEPVYYQWRRKNQPWSIRHVYHNKVEATTDDSEVRELYTTPPSSQLADAAVEAAIEATKEKAAKLCETLGKTSYVLPPTAADCAAAIRGMK
jgi:hypothetical protein